MSANGLKPAMSPKPIGPLSCVSGSCGFWPACIVGNGWGVEDAPPAPVPAGPARAAPFTMWIVCAVWILYVESASSSFNTRPRYGAGVRLGTIARVAVGGRSVYGCVCGLGLYVRGRKRAEESRQTRVDEPLPVRRDVGLVCNGLLEVCNCLLGRNGDLELELAGTCGARGGYQLCGGRTEGR